MPKWFILICSYHTKNMAVHWYSVHFVLMNGSATWIHRKIHTKKFVHGLCFAVGFFRVTGHLCGEFTGHRWIPRTKPVTRCFDAFFDLRLNKRLSKQSWGWWFETPSCSLWRHRNESYVIDFGMMIWLTWYQLSNPEKYWWFYHINWAITDNMIRTQHKKSQQNHSHIFVT